MLAHQFIQVVDRDFLGILGVHEDGDWKTAADKAKLHAFSHAGQSCISVQRILVHETLAEKFTDRFVENVAKLVTNKPKKGQGSDILDHVWTAEEAAGT